MDKPSAGKGRKAAARKAKPAKRVGGVLPDYLLPDVASVDVESEAGRTHLVMHMHRHRACSLAVHRCHCQQVWTDHLTHACKTNVHLRSCTGMPTGWFAPFLVFASRRWLAASCTFATTAKPASWRLLHLSRNLVARCELDRTCAPTFGNA